MKTHRQPHLLALLAAIVSLAAFPLAAAAITVNSTADSLTAGDGNCTLREAIVNANANSDTTGGDCAAGSGADTVDLPAGTYTLTLAGADEDASLTGDLDVSGDLTLTGAGAATTAIDANALDRVLHVHSGTVTISDVTIRNGLTPSGADGLDCTYNYCFEFAGDGEPGGGIYNQATLNLNRVAVTGNATGNGGNAGDVNCPEPDAYCMARAGDGGHGGGIYNIGTLGMDASSVTDNQTGSGGAAGSVSCPGGGYPMCYSDSGDMGNGGGAAGGVLTIVATTFSGNTAYDGGALQQDGANVSISRSRFVQNTATWSGGAINCNDGGASCTIEDSVFFGNAVLGGYGGGAIAFFNNGLKLVTNSTISGNTSTVDGGGIRAYSSPVYLTFVTIAGNTADSDNNGSGDGGGIAGGMSGAGLKNSILADNVDMGGQAPDCDAPLTNFFYNHIENLAGCGFTAGAGDVTGTDPGLDALADNGGGTETQALLAGSPALDRIPAGTNDCGVIDHDQRGLARPSPVGGACDVGAYEAWPEPAPCTNAPRTDCATPAKGVLKLIGNALDPTKQVLVWNWLKGTAALADFGDPGILGGTTSYRLCVYDDDALVMDPAVDTGGTCNERPCWSLAGTKGLQYKNKPGNDEGITMLKLKSGTGIASISARGKGSALALPFPLTDTTAIAVQLIKNVESGPQCWADTFAAPAILNDPVKLKFIDKTP